MTGAAASIIVDHHSALLEKFGPDDPRVLWNSRESQESRFAVLIGVGDLNGKTLLDVGCGLGDFSDYLVRRGIRFGRYRGMDLNPNMVAAALTRRPGAEIELRNLAESPLEPESYDYVFGSGIFNIAVPEWERITYPTLVQMYRTCRLGLAVNFLSRLSGNSNPAARYSWPSEVIAFVEKELSDKFVLRHDYRTNDFTVFVYKQGARSAHPRRS